LSGDGSLSSPYVVYNATGFRWLFQKKSLVSKYIELGADIILNEEQFDENGNCSGGDGIVYSHGSVYNSPNVSFNGNGHTIFGFFSKTSTGSCGLFPTVGTAGKVEEYCNIDFRNVYLEGKSQVHCLGYIAQRIENVRVLSGFLKGESDVSSLVFSSNDYVKNCVNYAKIVCSEYHTAGLVIQGSCDMEDCENFGSVEGENHYVAGLMASLPRNSTIKNCANYGEVKGSTMYTGGLFAVQTNAQGTCLIGCKNFAKVTGGKYIGGIIGALLSEVNVCFIDCANYGFVSGKNNEHGELIGYCISSNYDVQLQFFGCRNEGKSPRQYIINYLDAKNLELTMKNCDFDFSGSYNNNVILTVTGVEGNKHIFLENLNIVCKEGATRFTMFYTMGNAKNYVNIKNVYIQSFSQENIIASPIVYSKKESVFSVDGAVIEDVRYGKKIYGNDFSGFYIDYKTGKIGLKALSGKGFYQGKVTEGFLIDKGYVKKFI